MSRSVSWVVDRAAVSWIPSAYPMDISCYRGVLELERGMGSCVLRQAYGLHDPGAALPIPDLCLD